MPGFKVTIEMNGMRELLAAFKGVEVGMLDLRQLGTWKAVATEFRKAEKAHLNAEGSGKSGRFKRLTPKYAERKRKVWGDKPILQASGDMFASLTEAGHPNHVFEETAQEMIIGTRDPKAGYHQRGTGRLPSRPPMDFTEAQEKQLTEPISKKLKQLIGNAKLRDLRGF